jgi:capsular polysaccharide transport system permease protein
MQNPITSAVLEQWRIVVAILLRDIKIAYGQKRIGFVWAVLEPLVHIGVILLIKEFVFNLTASGIDTAIFLFSGIVPFFLFRDTANRITRSVDKNRSLLVFPQIKIMDFVAASALYELFVKSIVFVVLYVLLSIFIQPIIIEDYFMVICYFMLFWLMGIGFGIVAMVLDSLFPITKNVIKLGTRVLYFTSAVFISVDKMPTVLAPYLQYNPVLHLMELYRSSFFYEYAATNYTNIYFVLGVISVAFLAGLVLKQRFITYLLGNFS